MSSLELSEPSLPAAKSRKSPWSLRKLNHDAARQEQRMYWSQKTIAERLAAATELTRHLYRMRGIDIDERKADFTPHRVRRRRSLIALGVPMEGLKPNDLLDDEENIRFGPNEDHIDILASIGTMAFDQVWRNHVETVVQGVSICSISKADLIENKRQVGKLRDLADVEELERIPKQPEA